MLHLEPAVPVLADPTPPDQACGDYVLVTPARNEEQTIGVTVACVVAQTLRPKEWVIVSDESTDGTDAIVAHFAQRHPWIRLLRLRDRPDRGFASVVFVLEAGIRALQTRSAAFIGLLDADVRFGPGYFEQLLARFAADARLGLGGGMVVDLGGRAADVARGPRGNVAGAVQFFRRECFESLGGLVAIPEGGWDALTCVQARRNGYRTEMFTDLHVDHLKPRNSASGGLVRRHWQLGVRDYALGYHPVFEFVKCIYRIAEQPLLLGAACRLGGFVSAVLRRRPQHTPPALRQYLRAEQLERLHLRRVTRGR